MKYLLVAAIMSAAIFTPGCSSSTSNSSANSNTEIAANTNTAALVPYTPANGPNIDPTAANLSNTATANQAQVKIATPANAKPMSYPAPDDSEYVTTMNSSGQAIETRTFHNNPSIVKVERIWKDVNDKTVNIYLKSGKVVKVPGDKLSEIKSIPVETFYELAGVKPSQPAANGASSTRKEEKPKQ